MPQEQIDTSILALPERLRVYVRENGGQFEHFVLRIGWQMFITISNLLSY